MSDRRATEYYVAGSDRCPDAADCLCGDDLDYCVDFALDEWRDHDGQLSYSVCYGEHRVVAFNPTDHVPERRRR